jgi:hypothetical protein
VKFAAKSDAGLAEIEGAHYSSWSATRLRAQHHPTIGCDPSAVKGGIYLLRATAGRSKDRVVSGSPRRHPLLAQAERSSNTSVLVSLIERSGAVMLAA